MPGHTNIYYCGVCGTRVSSNIERKCVECGVLLCQDCQVNALCPSDYSKMNNISPIPGKRLSSIIKYAQYALTVYLAGFILFLFVGDVDQYAVTTVEGTRTTTVNYVLIFLLGIWLMGGLITFILRMILFMRYGHWQINFYHIHWMDV